MDRPARQEVRDLLVVLRDPPVRSVVTPRLQVLLEQLAKVLLVQLVKQAQTQRLLDLQVHRMVPLVQLVLREDLQGQQALKEARGLKVLS